MSQSDEAPVSQGDEYGDEHGASSNRRDMHEQIVCSQLLIEYFRLPFYLLIGVSSESTLHSVDKALFFLSPSSIVTLTGHLQPTDICSLDNCTQEVSLHSVFHRHRSSPLPYFKMNKKNDL